MPVLLPVFLLILGGVVLLILGRTRTTVGSLWLIASVLSFAEWLLMIGMRFRVPASFEKANWIPGGASQDLIDFSITPANWILAFALISVLTCIMFTNALRLKPTNRIALIVGPFLLSGLILLSLMSTSPLSFLLTWSVLDILELGIMVAAARNEPILNKTIISFVFRVIGTFLALAALVMAGKSGNTGLVQAGGTAYVLYVLAAGFRTGAFPLSLPFSREETDRRSLGTLLRLASPVAAFAMMAQLPAAASFSGGLWILFLLSSLIAVYGAAMWLTSRNDLAARQYWILAFSGMAGICVLRGQSLGVITLGMIMLLAGGFVFAQDIKINFWNPLTALLLFNLFGFPFTPSAGIWMNSQSAILIIGNVILLVSLSMIITGMIKFLNAREKSQLPAERWIRVFYLAGLFIILISGWLPLIWDRSSFSLYPGWIWSVCLLGVTTLGIALRSYVHIHPLPEASPVGFTLILLGKIGSLLRAFLGFEWLTTLVWSMYQWLGKVISFFNSILEGEGGILWALLFLALLASLLSTTG